MIKLLDLFLFNNNWLSFCVHGKSYEISSSYLAIGHFLNNRKGGGYPSKLRIKPKTIIHRYMKMYILQTNINIPNNEWVIALNYSRQAVGFFALEIKIESIFSHVTLTSWDWIYMLYLYMWICVTQTILRSKHSSITNQWICPWKANNSFRKSSFKWFSIIDYWILYIAWDDHENNKCIDVILRTKLQISMSVWPFCLQKLFISKYIWDWDTIKYA